MKRVLNSVLNFSILYFSVLLLDLSFIIWSDIELMRIATKPLLIMLLMAFYASNDKESTSNKFIYLVLALSCFLLANIMTLFKAEPIVLMAGSLFFILAKVFYVCRFSNNRDFNLKSSIPFVALYLLYMFAVLNVTMENLGSSLIPILVFLFVTLIAVQFAFLRKYTVNNRSYVLVITGILLLLGADTSAVLSRFYYRFPYQEVVTMFLYGLSQFLIVLGLVHEKIDKSFKPSSSFS